MTWRFKGQNFLFIIDHDDSTGALSGAIDFIDDRHRIYAVTGQWAASGSVPGRAYSNFYLTGSDHRRDSDWLVASGYINGSGASPDSIDIIMLTCSSASHPVAEIHDTLLPSD